MKTKAVFIDTKNRSVEEIEVSGLADFQKAVGGYIETACILDNQDQVFVNEDGMMRFDDFFFIEGGIQPYAGNAIVVGPCDEDGDNSDCLYSADDIKNRVTFMNRAEVVGWLNQQRHYDRVGGWMRMI